MARLQTPPIDVAALLASVRADSDGAVALFVGTVRDHHRGRAVDFLEYQAYDEMAEREMSAIETEAERRFEIGRVAIIHRRGRLEIGEVSVAVAVAAPHRAAAIEACRFAIDRLKRTVPIWKKEHFGDGSVEWVEGGV